MKRAAVIGGANMDIRGASSAALRLRDSNPGVVTVRPGGVGRNIAHDLRLFGMEVSLITAIGADVYGSVLEEDCLRLGLDMSMTRKLPEQRSSTYLYIADETGDMVAAVNDMGITGFITPEYLLPLMERLNGYDAVVVDANLPEQTIEFLALSCTAPMYADAVSAAKAKRLLPLLPKLRALKPNLAEARELTGETEAEDCARALVDMGVEQVFVSLGAKGLLAADREGCIRLPAEPTDTLSTNGCGDAMTAAVTFARTLGLSLEETAKAGIRAGTLNSASAETCAQELATIFSA